MTYDVGNILIPTTLGPITDSVFDHLTIRASGEIEKNAVPIARNAEAGEATPDIFSDATLLVQQIAIQKCTPMHAHTLQCILISPHPDPISPFL